MRGRRRRREGKEEEEEGKRGLNTLMVVVEGREEGRKEEGKE